MIIPQLAGGFGSWFGAGVALWAVAALAGVAWRNTAGPQLPLLLGAGSALTLAAAVAGGDQSFAVLPPWFLGVAPFGFVADGLSRWFLGIIGFVGMAVALFSPDYLQHLRKRVAIGFVWAALAVLM